MTPLNEVSIMSEVLDNKREHGYLLKPAGIWRAVAQKSCGKSTNCCSKEAR